MKRFPTDKVMVKTKPKRRWWVLRNIIFKKKETPKEGKENLISIGKRGLVSLKYMFKDKKEWTREINKEKVGQVEVEVKVNALFTKKKLIKYIYTEFIEKDFWEKKKKNKLYHQNIINLATHWKVDKMPACLYIQSRQRWFAWTHLTEKMKIKQKQTILSK